MSHYSPVLEKPCLNRASAVKSECEQRGFTRRGAISSGTRLYAWLQKGLRAVTAQELAKLRSETVRLWNGSAWIPLLELSARGREGDEIKLQLRSGESISCSSGQRWLTQRGVVATDAIMVGDKLVRGILPEFAAPLVSKCLPDIDIGWIVGMYLAEGSGVSTGKIEIASHIENAGRFKRLDTIARQFDSRCRVHRRAGKSAVACINSKVLSSVILAYLAGVNAKTKRLQGRCWNRSNRFLDSLLDGYLEGDGHFERCNSRWQLRFSRNRRLEHDLRTVCARLGYELTLNPLIARIGEQEYPAIGGSIRKQKSFHHNAKDRGEVLGIERSRARLLYEVKLHQNSSSFALASGILGEADGP